MTTMRRAIIRQSHNGRWVVVRQWIDALSWRKSRKVYGGSAIGPSCDTWAEAVQRAREHVEAEP